MFVNLFFENIKDICKIINYEAPFPPNNDDTKVKFEKIISFDDWNKLISNESGIYKNLLVFLINKKIFTFINFSTEWEFNSKILTDIIESFQFYLFKNSTNNQTIFDIKHLPYFYYDKDIEKVFNTYSENHLRYLKQTRLYPILVEQGIELDSEDAHFLNFICAHITEEIIIEYFIHGQDMDFLKFPIFYDWYDFDDFNKMILHAKNPDKRRNFQGILTKENLYPENFENLYLLNEIYVPVKVVLKNRYNPKDVKFITPQDFKNLKPEDLVGYEYKFNGEFNPIIIDDIFYTFKRGYIDDIADYIYNDVDKIDIEYNLAFDYKEKNKLLRSKLKKYSKIIKKIELTESLLECNEDLNTNNKEFYEVIKDDINFNDEIVDDFLILGLNMDFFKYDIFEEWHLLCYNIKVLENIKLKLSNLKTKNSAKKEQKTEPKSIEYYSKIWIDEKYETMFHKYLIKENVIDIDNKNRPRTGFKDVAGVILRIKSSIKIQIIKERVSRKDLANFLNKKYNAKIVIKKGFKIGNSNHITDRCEDFINAFLKKNTHRLIKDE
jgi:hypothetical protein